MGQCVGSMDGDSYSGGGKGNGQCQPILDSNC